MDIHMEVRLKRMHCGNTEDVHGCDELYFTSALSDGSTDNTRAAIVGIVRINDNQWAEPDEVIFSATLPQDRVVRGGVIAFDEDAGKDWSKKPEWVAKAKDAVVQGLKKSGDPWAVAGGEILKWGYTAFDALMTADKDDKLGRKELQIPVSGPEEESITWHFWNKGDWLGYSSWNYSVIFEVRRSREPLRTAVWKPSNVDDYCIYDWTREDFLNKDAECRGKKGRLQLLQAYVNAGQERWNAVWHPLGCEEQCVYGWNRQDFAADAEKKWSQGLRLHILQAYVLNRQELWNAVWRPGSSDDTLVYGWSRPDFLAKDDEQRKAGMRLHLLQAYVVNGTELWNAVWRPSKSDETAVYGWLYEDYRKKYDEIWKKNWRLELLNVHVFQGKALYNATWRPGNSSEVQVYGTQREEFMKKDTELRGKGLRLHAAVTF